MVKISRLRFVISAQCSECHFEEIQLSAGKRRPTAEGNWGEREGRSRRAKALLRVDDKK